jgi:hypothetical protein
MCIRTVRKGHQDKLKNQGDVCIFVSYLDNHYHDTYRLLNIKKKKIIESRDVRWTGKMYGTYKKKEENENEEESNEQDWLHKDIRKFQVWIFRKTTLQ